VGRDVSKIVLANSLSLWVRGLGRPVFQTRQLPLSEAKRHPFLLAGSSFRSIASADDSLKLYVSPWIPDQGSAAASQSSENIIHQTSIVERGG